MHSSELVIPARSSRRVQHWLVILAASCLATTLAAAPASPAAAASSPTVVINGGGGTTTSDGLHIEVSRGPASRLEQIFFNGTAQYYSGTGGNAGPYLSIGGKLFGPPPASGAVWTSVEVLATEGSAVNATSSSAVGSGSATIRYTAEVNTLRYIAERRLSYTFPNNFFTDDYTFVIPEGNTKEVKFYAGGDTTPGGTDQGYGIMLTSPVRSVISLDKDGSKVQIGYREVSGSRPFTGAVAQHYSSPFLTLASGGDLQFSVTTSSHDAGIMIQWSLGSTPGSHTGSFQTFVGPQTSSVNASFLDPGGALGSSVVLSLSVDNTLLTPVTGAGYTFTLPSGLTVSDEPQSNGCGGTLTATADGDTIVLTGGAVAATDNCVVYVPVTAAANGVYTISRSSVSGLAKLSNGVGTTSVTFGTVPTPPAGTIPPLSVGGSVHVQLTSTAIPAPMFIVTSGSLPAGLTLDAATGILSGTPTGVGPYSFSIGASNVVGVSSQSFSGTITPQVFPPVWVSSSLGELTVGEAFTAELVVTGSSPFGFSATAGAIPAGLSLDSATGTLSGIPLVPGEYDVTITASNAAGDADQRFQGTVGTTAPSLDLNLDLVIDTAPDAAANSFSVTGEGMLPGSEYSIVLRSTPVVLFTGTVPSNGRIANTLQLPAGIAPGVHSVTVTGTSAAGTTVSSVAWFRIDSRGLVTGISYRSAAALAETGAEPDGTIAAAILLTASGAAALWWSRRSRRGIRAANT